MADQTPPSNGSRPADQSPPDLLAARAGAGRPKGFFELPGVRKFMRNTPAVWALGIIVIFFTTAFAVMVPPKLISENAVKERVGPSSLPGLGVKAPFSDREDHAGRILSDVDKALRSSDPVVALQAFGYAERRLVTTDPDQISTMLDEIYALFDEFDIAVGDKNDALDELLDAKDDGLNAQGDPVNAEMLVALQQRFNETSAAAYKQLDDLEVAIEGILPVPDSLAYKLRMLLGTDSQGRSIFLRAVYSVKTAVQIGFVTALLSVVVGGLLGAASGFFGGWVDHVVVWMFSTVSAIPYLIWLIVIAFVVRESQWVVPVVNKPVGQTLIPVYIAFVLTFWVGPCRVIRGEAMKIKNLDYIQSARSIGASSQRILLKHVVPNTAYLLFINMSLLFVGAIKAEVILSFLGLGVQGQPSWGIMIRDAKDEVITGFFWQIGTATAFMFVLVLAFNIVSDALQDAFDPKHVG